jgi:hypothetical protein
MNLCYDLELKIYFIDHELTDFKNISSISISKRLDVSLNNIRGM